MCVMSMVHDNFNDRFKDFFDRPTAWPAPVSVPNSDLERLERLIKDFKEAINLAAKLDVVMKLPDCVDPEKAKLQARVAELEAHLAKVKETLNAQS